MAYGQRIEQVKSESMGDVSLAEIERVLRRKTLDLRVTRPGAWRLSIDGVLVLLVAEDQRIRILAPIFSLHQLDSEPNVRNALMIRLLQSNFERSADARYAIFDGIVFATVTHPRPTLGERLLDQYILQVVNLHKNTFRTGRTGYSASTPDPESVEIDPRQDETLRAPGEFEGDAVPKPPSAPEADESEPEPASDARKRIYL